jgi:cyclohexanone monooxygenase
MAESLDVVVVGAGFAGLYLCHRLKASGRTVKVLEQGSDVGGTWYWNRYPGARCDAESLAYSFSFSESLEQEWQWSERYAQQPEILAYAQHVADRFDLRPWIDFDTRVESASWLEDLSVWEVRTDTGQTLRAAFCIMATGCLSVPQRPSIEGLDTFQGKFYQASQWPHESVNFLGQRVGIIGTGSSGIQAIPVIASEADHLTVFQRTPNFSVPAQNGVLDPDWVTAFKSHYRAHRENHKVGNGSGFGDLDIKPREAPADPILFSSLSEAEATAVLEEAWRRGGARFMAAIGDTLMDEQANAFAQEFVHKKIREIVKDPITAEALCPTTHPIGTRRICVDINYYETYNADHVRLVNLRESPVVRITPWGVELESENIELDTLVIATGFDAMTGALLKMQVTGKSGLTLQNAWMSGPKTYLGLMTADFPNLFMITGPGSPSVLSNMLVSIEQHVDWVLDCLEDMAAKGKAKIEPSREAQETWVEHVQAVANATLFPKGGSWYLGANVPGKPRIFMPYAAGVGPYREVCQAVASDHYRGFNFE